MKKKLPLVHFLLPLSSLNGFEGIEGARSLIYRVVLKMNKSENNQKSIVSSFGGEVKMARSKYIPPPTP